MKSKIKFISTLVLVAGMSAVGAMTLSDFYSDGRPEPVTYQVPPPHEVQAISDHAPSIAVNDTKLDHINNTNTLRQEALRQMQADQIADLSDQIEQLHTLVASLSSAETKTMADKVDPNEPMDPEMQEAENLRQIQQQIQLFDDTLETEAIDAQWAHDAVKEITQRVYATDRDDIGLQSLDCRTTMCRMEVFFEPGRYEDTFNNLQDFIPWSGEMFFRLDDVSMGEAVVYIARQDYALPRQ